MEWELRRLAEEIRSFLRAGGKHSAAKLAELKERINVIEG